MAHLSAAQAADKPRIVLDQVTVRIPLLSTPHRSLKNTALRIGTGGRLAMESGKVPEVLALDEISLDLRPGTRLGLIGHNGAGKTTLLRVMAGILAPTSGKVMVKGRVAAAINPSMGLNPEATGREAILVQSLIAGASREECAGALPGIAEFTELGAYLDLPIRTYSKGMCARLGFAVATAYAADIVLIDENISAGDAAFAERARRRLRSWLADAGIIVMATHAMDLIKANCNETVRLEAGKIVGRQRLN